MPAEGLVELRGRGQLGQYFIKHLFPVFMHFNSQKWKFYPNLVSDYTHLESVLS